MRMLHLILGLPVLIGSASPCFAAEERRDVTIRFALQAGKRRLPVGSVLAARAPCGLWASKKSANCRIEARNGVRPT